MGFKKVKIYYQLTKPGIIYGNALTAAAGFFLAEKGRFSLVLFWATLIGLSLVIASGCVFNNVLDGDIDQKMERTKNRATASGIISKKNVLVYGTLLGLVGFAILLCFTNLLALAAAVVGWVVYVLLYTPLKRKTVLATLIGSIAGATPPVVGYCAVTNKFDVGAILLFLILVFWQMPHFYAIAIYRLKDYRDAIIPVLPLKSGVKATKIQILFYITAFILAAILLTVFGYMGYIYLTAVIVLGLVWLWLAAKGFNATDNAAWAKQIFRYSLIALTLFCVIVSFNRLLP